MAAIPPRCFMCGATMDTEEELDRHVILCAKGQLRPPTPPSPPSGEKIETLLGQAAASEVPFAESATSATSATVDLSIEMYDEAEPSLVAWRHTTDSNEQELALHMNDEDDTGKEELIRSPPQEDPMVPDATHWLESGGSTPVENGNVSDVRGTVALASETKPHQETTPLKQRRRRPQHTTHKGVDTTSLEVQLQSLEELQTLNQQRLREAQQQAGSPNASLPPPPAYPEPTVDGSPDGRTGEVSGNPLRRSVTFTGSSSRLGGHPSNAPVAGAASLSAKGISQSYGANVRPSSSLDRSASNAFSFTTTTQRSVDHPPFGRTRSQHADPSASIAAAPNVTLASQASPLRGGGVTRASLSAVPSRSMIRTASSDPRRPSPSPQLQSARVRSSTVAGRRSGAATSRVPSHSDGLHNMAPSTSDPNSLDISIEAARSEPPPAPTRASTTVRQRTAPALTVISAVPHSQRSTISSTTAVGLTTSQHTPGSSLASTFSKRDSSWIFSTNVSSTRTGGHQPATQHHGSSRAFQTHREAGTFSSKGSALPRSAPTAAAPIVFHRSAAPAGTSVSAVSGYSSLQLSSGSVLIGGPVPQPRHDTLRAPNPAKKPSLPSGGAMPPPSGSATITRSSAAVTALNKTISSQHYNTAPPPQQATDALLKRKSVSPPVPVRGSSTASNHAAPQLDSRTGSIVSSPQAGRGTSPPAAASVPSSQEQPTPAALFCADCGGKYVDHAKFCAFCGHKREFFGI